MEIEQNNQVQFKADTVRVSGPRQSDGSFLVTFELGEYMSGCVAKILSLPRGNILKVTIDIE